MTETKRVISDAMKLRAIIGDRTTAVTTRRPRISWIFAKNVEHVTEVESNGSNTQQHLGMSTCIGCGMMRKCGLCLKN